MKKNIKSFYCLLFLTSGLALQSAEASSCEVDISDYVGWTIIYSGTVTGFIDENGREQDSFEGCEFGRILIVDYSKQVTCQTFSYSYAYLPDIVVLDDGYSRKACIDDDMYDIR